VRWSAAAAAEAAAERARVAEATGADDDRDAVERDGRIVEKGQKKRWFWSWMVVRFCKFEITRRLNKLKFLFPAYVRT